MSAIHTGNGQIDISNSEVINGTADIVLFDPKNQTELEHLNNATDRINTLESELDKARSDFRCLLNESSAKVNSLCKKLGSCVEKAKLCRDSRLEARKLFTETEHSIHLQDQRILSARKESEKVVHQLHQELKKSIVKSCLSTRRSLLQLNNLANQHQLQLLPYFEMKAQFNQMFDEQIKNVPPLDESDFKIKMNDFDGQFHLEKSREEIEYRFNDGGSNNGCSKASNSMSSSYQDSLSSENVYLEHLTSEDVFMALPSNLKLTAGLVNCTLSHSNNSCLKSPNHHSNEVGSSIEDLSSKASQDSLFHNSLLREEKSNGYQHYKETLKQSNDSIINIDAAYKISEVANELLDTKASECPLFTVNDARYYDDNMLDLSVASSDQTNSLDD